MQQTLFQEFIKNKVETDTNILVFHTIYGNFWIFQN